MLRGKDIALIFRWELFAAVEDQLEGSTMSLQEHIGDKSLVLQFRMLALMTGILMPAYVPPGPPVETAGIDVSDVIRNEIVTQTVAFIDRAPKLPRFWIDRQPSAGIANSVSVNAHARAVRIELEDVGAVFLLGGCVGVVNVRCRPHRDEHFLAVRTELYIARPVVSSVRKINEMLRSSACLQIAILIRKSNYGICVSDIDPFRIISDRIECDTVRLIESGGEYSCLPCFSVFRDSAEYPDYPAAIFRQENVAVGCGAE